MTCSSPDNQWNLQLAAYKYTYSFWKMRWECIICPCGHSGYTQKILCASAWSTGKSTWGGWSEPNRMSNAAHADLTWTIFLSDIPATKRFCLSSSGLNLTQYGTFLLVKREMHCPAGGGGSENCKDTRCNFAGRDGLVVTRTYQCTIVLIQQRYGIVQLLELRQQGLKLTATSTRPLIWQWSLAYIISALHPRNYWLYPLQIWKKLILTKLQQRIREVEKSCNSSIWMMWLQMGSCQHQVGGFISLLPSAGLVLFSWEGWKLRWSEPILIKGITCQSPKPEWIR